MSVGVRDRECVRDHIHISQSRIMDDYDLVAAVAKLLVLLAHESFIGLLQALLNWVLECDSFTTEYNIFELHYQSS
jgi:hypothetical protein